jgi:hypothetical protein
VVLILQVREPCLCLSRLIIRLSVQELVPLGALHDRRIAPQGTPSPPRARNSAACNNCATGTYSVAGALNCNTCSSGTSNCGTGNFACTAGSCNTATHSALERSCGVSASDTCSASESSDLGGLPAYLSVDGNLGSFGHTNGAPSWWMLDFGRTITITGVIVYNRADCCQDRLNGYSIAIGESTTVGVNPTCASNLPAPMSSPFMAQVTCTTPLNGRYLIISAPTAYLHLGEVQVTGCPCSSIATLCNAGFTGPDGGACTACVAGKYKVATGSAVCADCAAGKYSTTVVATLESTCVVCPSNSNSPIASVALTSCTCNVGFTGPDGGACTACVAGKYKIATGSAVCADCAAGKYSTTVGATLESTCVVCPSNSNSPIASVALTACICNVGFTGPNDGACTACVAGKYKIATGSAVCADCAANTFSSVTGATSSAVCASCATGFFPAVSVTGACTSTSSTLERSCGLSGTDVCTTSQSSTDPNLLNGGVECWGICGETDGPCSYCGGGSCCRQGWSSSWCNGIGGLNQHQCVAGNGMIASKALDGNLDSSSSTSNGGLVQWWRLDFGRSVSVAQVIVYNRGQSFHVTSDVSDTSSWSVPTHFYIRKPCRIFANRRGASDGLPGVPSSVHCWNLQSRERVRELCGWKVLGNSRRDA